MQIGIFGRTNVGKSSFLNMIAGQDVSIISDQPGTTTDVVEKTMELLPIGPVVLLDTAGVDDISSLSSLRMEKTDKIFERADVAAVVIEPQVFGDFEKELIKRLETKNIPYLFIINKTDANMPENSFLAQLNKPFIEVSCLDSVNRNKYVHEFKAKIKQVVPASFFNNKLLVADLVPAGGIAVLIIPIDFEAPKGRIILPQVQTIRELLDNDSASMVVKESEYVHYLSLLKNKPDLVVCDSQVVDKMVAGTPDGVPCTTFSILLARLKGELQTLVDGVMAFENIKPKDKILIAESCSHHPIEDDIARVKMPKWIKARLGFDPQLVYTAGRDFSKDLSEYKLVIHCGACMLTRNEMQNRMKASSAQEIPMTNYGIAISYLLGVLYRVLQPFPGIEIKKKGK